MMCYCLHGLRTLRFLVFIAGFLSSYAGAVQSEATDQALASLVQRAGIEELAQAALLQDKSPGLVLSVIAEGKVIFLEAYGVRNLETQAPMQTDAIFQIASLTKTFVGTLGAKLVAKGRVSLDEDIRRYDPKLVFHPSLGAQVITLRHLLSHQSGLPNNPINRSNIAVPNLPTDFDPTIPAPYNLSDLYDGIAKTPLRGRVGAQYRYSNLGMVLAAHILTVAGGYETAQQAIETEITKPLGMEDTFVRLDASRDARMPQPYAFSDDKYHKVFPLGQKTYYPIPAWTLGNAIGGAGLSSTAQDLATYVAHVAGGVSDFLSPATRGILFEPNARFVDRDETVVDIGLGWRSLQFGPHGTVYQHSGHNDGHHATMLYSPSRDVGVISLTNGSYQANRNLGAQVLLDVLEQIEKHSNISGKAVLAPGIFRGQEVERGLLTVKEHPDNPASTEITIEFMRFAARTQAKAPPLFILPGGPAWSMRHLTDDYLGHTPSFSVIERMRESQDVILMEQRGGPYAFPNLDCVPSVGTREVTSDRASYAAAMRDLAKACKTIWAKRGVDLSAYTVINAAHDVEALRQALGYGKINLHGESFGSHWAIGYMRLYPQNVARAFLSGLEGPDHTYDIPSQVVASLERLAATAQNDATLAPLIPKGGLISALQDVIETVERERPRVTVQASGETIILTGEDIRRIARGVPRATSRHNAAQWPKMVLELMAGNYQAAAKAALKARRLKPWSGLFMAMDCASGISEQRRKQLNDAEAIALIGDINLGYRTVCEIWNDVDLGPRFRNGSDIRVPTILFQGTWDISTPPENAQSLQFQFKNAHYVTVEGGTHFESWRTLAVNEAFYSAVMGFLKNGATSELPESIAIEAPDFAAPSTQP